MDHVNFHDEFHSVHYGSFGGLCSPNIKISQADLFIVGIPFENATSGQKGCSFSPSKLRLLSPDMQTLTRRGKSIEKVKIKDLGDVSLYPYDEKKNFALIEKSFKKLFTSTDSPVIAIGGDHSITYPEVSALSQKTSIGLVWIDAHRDVLDTLNGSKFSHGCSLRRIIESQAVAPENVLLIGTRYLEAEDTQYIEEQGINELKMSYLDDCDNPRKIIKKKITELHQRVKHVFLSIDIDAVDPSAAPGTGTPVSGGLTSNLLLNIIYDFPITIRAADIVEVSPPLDSSASITTKLQMAILSELIGKMV